MFFGFDFFQAYRLNQIIHNEIATRLSLIDKNRINIREEDIRNKRIDEHKAAIADILTIALDLKRLIHRVNKSSIGPPLEMLMHKFNLMKTESNIYSLKSYSPDKKLDMFKVNTSQYDVSSLGGNFESVYLDNLLETCGGIRNRIKFELEESEKMDQQKMVTSVDKPREKIKVNLRKFTSEERLMIDDLGRECIESIIDNL